MDKKQRDRLSRAKKEFHTYYIEPSGGNPFEYKVWNSNRSRIYAVNIQKQGCTCPDSWKHGNKCKHIFAVELYEDTYRQEDPVENYMKGYIGDWQPSKTFTWF